MLFKSYPYSSTNDSQLDNDKLGKAIEALGFEVDRVDGDANGFTIYLVNDLVDWSGIDAEVSSHNGAKGSQPRIYALCDVGLQKLDFRDIDYTIKNLFPKRVFSQGELQSVEWYIESTFQTKVLKAEMSYTRDGNGFATYRETLRTWINEDDSENPLTKLTSKFYTPLEMIQEGKRRRGNIVDGVQIPTLSFMLETMVNPPTVTQDMVLLIGRDFMDRFEDEFNKFIDNSSTVTDPADPDFLKKKVVVAIENAANSTDPWLKNKPASLGGSISIENYLVSEFSI